MNSKLKEALEWLTNKDVGINAGYWDKAGWSSPRGNAAINVVLDAIRRDGYILCQVNQSDKTLFVTVDSDVIDDIGRVIVVDDDGWSRTYYEEDSYNADSN